MNCPQCQGVMTAFSDPNPPWVCNTCVRGWWATELASAALGKWRPGFRDFGDPAHDTAAAALLAAITTDARSHRTSTEMTEDAAAKIAERHTGRDHG